jgi:hypothetical protein
MTLHNEVHMTDTLVPDKIVREEFGISAMALWRWDHDPDLGFPPPIYIRRREFRSRNALEKFKQQMVRKAISGRP